MDLQHLNVKVFVAEPAEVRFADFVGIFNSWIQRKVGDELLIDVADYSHVFAGPGVLLIGHEANYSLDNAGDRPGLLYNRKARVKGSPADKLRQALRAALAASRRLETENGLRFNGDEIQITVNDRLLAPNSGLTFAGLAPEIEAVFEPLYGEAGFALAPNPDPRARFSVTVTAAGPHSVAEVLGRLAVEGVAAHA